MEVDNALLTINPQTTVSDAKSQKQLTRDALEVNRKLQKTLSHRAVDLEAELKELDRLLAASNTEEGEDDPESEISIPGAKKAAGLFPSTEFLNTSSPFYEASMKRHNFVTNTRPRPLKEKDLELLADAVQKENERLEAYRLSRISGTPSAASSVAAKVVIDNLEGLDWTRIAERVSDASSVRRNATECRITWISNQHPYGNHAEWSPQELSKLESIIVEYHQQSKTVNWVEVATKLGTNRIPIDCMRHGVPRQRHNWSQDSDQKLIKAVESCGIDNWQLVARQVSEHATATQCQTRWMKSLDPALKRGAWTDAEDNALRKAVAGYGPSWLQVAAVVPGRTNDQCRERWVDHLNVGGQIAWTEEEDRILLDSAREMGNKWKDISIKIGNKKTGQACRQRYDKLKRVEKSQTSTVVGSSTPTTNAPPSLSVGSLPTNNLPESHEPPTVSSLADTGTASAAVATSTPQAAARPKPRPKPRGKGKGNDAIDEAGTATNAAPSSTVNNNDGEASSGVPTKPKPKARRKAPNKPTQHAREDTGNPEVAEPAAASASESITPEPVATTSSTPKGRKRKAVDRQHEGASPPAKRSRTTRSQKEPTAVEKPVSEKVSTNVNAGGPTASHEPQATLRRGRSAHKGQEVVAVAEISSGPAKRGRGRPRKSAAA